MATNPLHEFHQAFGAKFKPSAGTELVEHYGDVRQEFLALRDAVGVIDLSARGRLCVLGADRLRFLHGQVTNSVKDLPVGRGCYAALVSAKGKIESDLNLYVLEEEVLLDFEPGLTDALVSRLERYIIADDVQLADVAPHYGLLSVQGPLAAQALAPLGLELELPVEPFQVTQTNHVTLGKIYCMNQPRLLSRGYDLFIPTAALAAVADQLVTVARALGGSLCGWQAFEVRRIECGLPRFGIDMDGTNLAPETGIEARAISYNKGCYIGQEVIARIRTYGQVSKSVRGLRLDPALRVLPAPRDKLFAADREVGYITSATFSPTFNCPIALGYVRREQNQPGQELIMRTASGDYPARVVPLPFRKEDLI